MGAKGGKTRMLKISEVVDAYEVMKHHLKKVPGTDAWSYIDGHSDASLANILSTDIPGITVRNVATVREQCFGKLYVPSKERSVGDRICALEKNVVDLYRKLNEAETAILSLLDRLDNRS